MNQEPVVQEGDASGMVTVGSHLEALSLLRKRVRNGDFGSSLLTQANALRTALPILSDEGQLPHLKAINTIFEILSYYGRYSEAFDLLSRPGGQINEQIRKWTRSSDGHERRIVKEKITLLMHFGLAQYRSNDYGAAERMFDLCRSRLPVLVISDDDPCHSTRSELEYCCGQVYRQQLEYGKACLAFTASLEFAHKRLEWCKKNQNSDPKVAAEQMAVEERRAARRTALALALGLGFISSARGRQQQALPYFRAARNLLFSTNDWVNKAYIDLLFGSVLRTMAGEDKSKLDEVIETLQFPYETFRPGSAHSEFGHEPYRGHVAYQLALAHLYAGCVEESQKYVSELKMLALKTSDQRWQCNGLLVESRIQRKLKKLELADDTASKSMLLAEHAGQLRCQIDALIARGEVRFEQGHINKAIADFDMALSLVKENPQTEGVCHLHLAETHLRQNELRLAEDHFGQWQKIEPRVENQTVLTLAKRVGLAMDRLNLDFHISRDTHDLKYRHHAQQLWNFLRQEASRRFQTQEQVADSLGVSRQTLYKKAPPKTL